MTNLDWTDHDAMLEVSGYRVAVDRLYCTDTHMWVKPVTPTLVRLGLDSLGVETNGTLAQLSFVEPGTEVARGGSFGQLEAAKFVGPLASPLAGTVTSTNVDVLTDPGRVERDPYGEGWLVELSFSGDEEQLAGLLRTRGDITTWFTQAVADYRLKGVIAE